MPRPNFLIAGAAKAGTTSLYHYLGQHPDIFVSPVKELYFFACEGNALRFDGPGDEYLRAAAITDWSTYCSFFDGAAGERALGEASPVYLYSEEAPARIHRYVPDMKIIVVLRNPVDRAYSHFWHVARERLEPLSDFAQALEAEEARRRANWGWFWRYKDHGFYHRQLKRYFDTFDADQIRVYRYEDLAADTLGVLQDIFRFLEVDATFVPGNTTRYNKEGKSKSRLLHQLMRGRNPVRSVLRHALPLETKRTIAIRLRNLNTYKPPMPETVRAELMASYREDILDLQELLQRDFSDWLVLPAREEGPER